MLQRSERCTYLPKASSTTNSFSGKTQFDLEAEAREREYGRYRQESGNPTSSARDKERYLKSRSQFLGTSTNHVDATVIDIENLIKSEFGSQSDKPSSSYMSRQPRLQNPQNSGSSELGPGAFHRTRSEPNLSRPSACMTAPKRFGDPKDHGPQGSSLMYLDPTPLDEKHRQAKRQHSSAIQQMVKQYHKQRQTDEWMHTSPINNAAYGPPPKSDFQVEAVPASAIYSSVTPRQKIQASTELGPGEFNVLVSAVENVNPQPKSRLTKSNAPRFTEMRLVDANLQTADDIESKRQAQKWSRLRELEMKKYYESFAKSSSRSEWMNS
jgi:hypothetical protein